MSGALGLPLNGLVAGTNQFVLANGNVGIGSVAPAGKLDVAGTICFNGTNCISSWPGGGTTAVTSVTAGSGLTGGPITSTGSLSLATVGTAGTYAKVITDSFGRVVGSTSLIASDLPTISATTITTGTLAVANGGTGVNTLSNNGLLVGAGSMPVSTLSTSTQYNVLTASTGGVPTYGQVALNQSAAVTGSLLPANGGTGLAALGSANQLLGVVGAGGALEYKTIAGTAGEISVSNAAGTLTLATPQAIAVTSSPSFVTVNLSGSLGLGSIAPNSILDISGALTERGLASAPSASNSGQGVIYFDSALHHFYVSENGGSYQQLSSGVAATTVTAGAGLQGGSFATNGTISLPATGTAGTYVKVTTDTYGRVTGSASLTAADIPPLSASSITSGTLPLSTVPSLPASTITSGTLGLATIPNLPASLITSGTLALSTIPSLPASTITSGSFGVAQIPALPASIITTGSFNATQIPSLPAAILSSGTLNIAQLPAHSAALITSGTLNAAQLPSLAGSYVAVSGGTMSGALTLPLNGLVAGTSQFVLANGNVGIGSAAPAGKLDVAGTICFNGTNCISSWPGGGTTAVTSVAAGLGLTGGPITSTGSLSLATVGTAGSYSKVITDSFGRVVGATSLLTSDLPTISATTITTGTLSVANGGTGVNSFTTNGVVIGGPMLSATAVGSQYNVLTAGLGGSPGFGQVNLGSASAVSGALPVAFGGTGLTAAPANGQLAIGNGTGFVLSTLASGTGINVVNAAGSITINATADASSKLSKAGDTMGGVLTLPLNSLVAGTTQLVLAGGNVGIGTATPAGKLDVAGTICLNGTNCISAWPGGGTTAVTSVTAGIGLVGGPIISTGSLSLQMVGTAGSYTKVTTDAFGRVMGASSLLPSDIPPLAASAITSGSFTLAQIPALPAGIITSGTFSAGQIPTLPASIIGSGTLAVATIPYLPASTLTSGTLNIAQLPSFSAALITSGTLSGAVLPSLSGSYVAVTGSTMTGALTLPANGLVTGSNQLVLANGNLGIGTTAPSAFVDVRPAANQNLLVTAAGNTANSVRIAAGNDANTAYVPLEIDALATTFTVGNVGIGTTAAVSTLQLAAGNGGSANVGGRVTFSTANGTDSVGGAAVQSLNGWSGEGNGQDASLAFYTNQRTGSNAYTGLTEKMRITDAGNVGIGTTAPAATLEVAGSTSHPTVKTSSLMAQGYANNNTWLADNMYFNGSAWVYAGNGYADQLYFTGGDMQFNVAGNNTNGAGTGAAYTTALVVKNGGNVGIGTLSPLGSLNISGASNSTLYLQSPTHNAAGTIVTIAMDTYGVNLGQGPNPRSRISAQDDGAGGGILNLVTGYVDRLSILNNGNVGIGTTGPIAKLAIVVPSGTGVDADGAIDFDDGVANYPQRLKLGVNTAGNYAYIQSTQSNVGQKNLILEPIGGSVGIGTTVPGYTLHVVGTAGLSTGTSWTNASDIRLKDIEGDYEYGLGEIRRLHTVRFKYKAGNALKLPTADEHTGFIAQEVQKVIPDAVHKREDGYLELNVDPIHWATVNAVQELAKENDQLRLEATQLKTRTDTEISQLKNTANELKARADKSEADAARLRAFVCSQFRNALSCPK